MSGLLYQATLSEKIMYRQPHPGSKELAYHFVKKKSNFKIIMT